MPDTAPPGGPSRFEPPDGYAYFGFMYRLWESDDPAQGDTPDFAARICDAVDVELAGKTPSTLFVWSSWQAPTGTAQPFCAVLPDIQKIHGALGPGVVPLLEWAANSATDSSITPYLGITTKDVASGSLDDDIREYAREVRQYGAPLFIRLICGEFNGNWNAWCSPGVAVLAAIFSANGSYASPQTYVEGIIPAIAAGAAVVAAAAALATALPRVVTSLRAVEPQAPRTLAAGEATSLAA
jgi:hypothetical protein